MLKKFPIWKNEEEADERLTHADLSEYDLSDAKMMTFELAPKNTAISLRLPESLLNAMRARAVQSGIPMQRLIRAAIEAFLVGGRSKTRAAGKVASPAGGKRSRSKAA
jgi:predicted DNA binding CopG/RHH family protein